MDQFSERGDPLPKNRRALPRGVLHASVSPVPRPLGGGRDGRNWAQGTAPSWSDWPAGPRRLDLARVGSQRPEGALARPVGAAASRRAVSSGKDRPYVIIVATDLREWLMASCGRCPWVVFLVPHRELQAPLLPATGRSPLCRSPGSPAASTRRFLDAPWLEHLHVARPEHGSAICMAFSCILQSLVLIKVPWPSGKISFSLSVRL